MKTIFSSFVMDETGATAIEYGLIAAMMSVAIVAAFPTITGALSTAFGNIATNLKVN